MRARVYSCVLGVHLVPGCCGRQQRAPRSGKKHAARTLWPRSALHAPRPAPGVQAAFPRCPTWSRLYASTRTARMRRRRMSAGKWRRNGLTNLRGTRAQQLSGSASCGGAMGKRQPPNSRVLRAPCPSTLWPPSPCRPLVCVPPVAWRHRRVRPIPGAPERCVQLLHQAVL